jgi:type IV secretory pathway protease TraF
LQLFRDVHYLGRAGGEQSPAVEQTYRLGSNEFLLLGDNPQDSIDSRDWAQAGLPKSRLLGRIRRLSPE